MQELTAFAGIAAAMVIGAVSPGPSFVMVARTAASSTRANGLCAALGMGAGGALFAIASLLGLHGLLLAVPSLYVVLKVGGGLYLACLGIRIWRGAQAPLGVDVAEAGRAADEGLRSFALGLVTQLSNPKTAIVYASIFAAFLPARLSLAFGLAVVGLVVAIEVGWYSLVAMALSSSRPRNAYLRFKAWIDRAAGGIMVALGLKLVLTGQRA